MAFTQKLLTVSMSLANGVFGNGENTATLSGLRMSINIGVPGGQSMGALEGAIFGMTLSQMNALSTVGTQFDAQAQNTISVMAGDAESGMSLVYSGTLRWAFVDASSMPQVAFRISGVSGYYDTLKPVKPTSVQGAGDVATIMQGLAKQMGLAFENNGVNVKIANPYLSGSARMQVLTLAQQAGIGHLIDRGTLSIWNLKQGRQGAPFMVSPSKNLVGYPGFSQACVVVKTMFDPAITYGGKMQIQSDLTPACGTWLINNLAHQLDSMTPHGRWFSIISGTPVGSV